MAGSTVQKNRKSNSAEQAPGWARSTLSHAHFPSVRISAISGKEKAIEAAGSSGGFNGSAYSVEAWELLMT